ncbi:MAG: hypothetical protein GF346_08265 [Candidatus Eisenbacteria bacterium]|nr:hypothetical protein [Candidatus Latescibacterota bacterium]MBD3302427.1 hypothetical protein [Candidatus Eisenbacteria bacterium]
MGDEESFSDSVSRQAREWARQAGSATERAARVGRLQLDLLGLRREMQQEMRALGERVFELFRDGGAKPLEEDPIAGPMLRRLERLEGEKLLRRAQIERAREGSDPEEVD